MSDTYVIWCLAVYFISALLNRYLGKNGAVKRKEKPIRKHLGMVLWGLVAILVADQVSPEAPLWPALTLMTLVGGIMFPFRKNWWGPKNYYSLSSYFGGLLYLDPWVSLIILLLAIEMNIVAGDRLTGAALLVSLAPFLLNYSHWNPDFVWAAVGIGGMLLLYFHSEFRNRCRHFWKTASQRS